MHSSLDGYAFIPVRSAAVLTTSYVAGTVVEGRVDAKGNTSEWANQLIIYTEFTKASSTSYEFKVDFANSLAFDVVYDNQTANFTVGAEVRGTNSGATGRILADSDSGTTGTLTLESVKGQFFDNEAITDDNSTPGAAVVNGAVNPATANPSDATFYQDGTETVSGGTTTGRENEYTIVSANQSAATQRYRFLLTIKDRYIRISAKVTGTTTSTSVKTDAILGRT